MKNRGWNKKLMSWDFDKISTQGYPDWERNLNGKPFFVMMERNYNKKYPSIAIDYVFDDIAKKAFYNRNRMKSEFLFDLDEYVYWSEFWFESKEDAEKFVELFGGVGNWMPNFEEFNNLCTKKIFS